MSGNSRALALRVMGIYLVFAAAWILLSDAAAKLLFPDAHTISHFQTIKGLAFVGVTAFLLYITMLGPLRRRDRETVMRLAAEDSLRAANERNEALLKAIPDMLFVLDSEGKFLDYRGPSGVTLLPPEAFIGKPISEIMPEGIALEAIAKVKSVLASRGTEFQSYQLDGGGETRYFETRLAPYGSNAVVALCRDRTERHRVESALRKSEEKLRKLSHAVEQSTSSIVITDPDGFIEYVNPRFTAVTGYTQDELIGKTPSVLKSGDTPPEVYRNLWDTISQGGEWRGEFSNRRKNGEVYWEFASISPLTDESGKITHFVGVKEDITGRKGLEEQLRHVQKMEAFGQLAGGVAHDFNNYLAVIRMQTDLLRTSGNLGPEQAACAREIEQATERASNLTNQLLLFSRRQAMRPRDIDLNANVASITRMFERLLGDGIEVRVACAAEPLMIRADPGMIDQILVNLALNARDAMPAGGVLEISTQAVEPDAAEAAGVPRAKAGRYACLTVADTGMGISPEHLPHVFEPFFTTKDVGKGTGLGLATVFGIVEQHEGWLDVSSKPGSGTVFRLHFPLLARLAPEAPAQEPPLTTGCCEPDCILVVEDDASLRQLIRKVLEREGHRVCEAATGVKALSKWDECRGRIGLLLTDLVMPDGMSGIEVAGTLRKSKPDLRVVFMSGYNPETAGKDCPEFEEARFLPKPFGAADLSGIVRDAFDGHPAS
ncbi:MAG: PAS domain S-box protein [Verrucomicrobia bacterium]|nr:PAS domain S-box protein [Verrucomicrobiota bacterium]